MAENVTNREINAPSHAGRLLGTPSPQVRDVRITQIEDLFVRSLDMNHRERNEFLSMTCDGNDQLRLAVESLIEAHAAAGPSILDRTVDLPDSAMSGFSNSNVRPMPSVGDAVDAFILLKHLGTGGMGVVFLALERSPIRRLVAMKITSLASSNADALRRLSNERQALAKLRHSGIPQIYSAGQTSAGREYFTMEYVDGVRITDYCKEKQLSIHDRLRLLLQLCDAVDHVHQNGIIHRDIKPANVLIVEHDGMSSARLLDFGIANHIELNATSGLETQCGQIVGTLHYMSPEQLCLGFASIDFRTDIYSLGTLLYELLTGTTPFHNVADDEPFLTVNAVRTQAPQPPSANANRQSIPLSHQQTQELDRITLKCLSKLPADRYQNCTDLAGDLSQVADNACNPGARPLKRNRAVSRRTFFGRAIAASVLILFAATSVLVQSEHKETAAVSSLDTIQINGKVVGVDDPLYHDIVAVLKRNGIDSTAHEPDVQVAESSVPTAPSGPERTVSIVQVDSPDLPDRGSQQITVMRSDIPGDNAG